MLSVKKTFVKSLLLKRWCMQNICRKLGEEIKNSPMPYSKGLTRLFVCYRSIFLCEYLRATIVSSSEIQGTRILSISAAHIGALWHLLLNFQTKNLSKMTHLFGEDFKRIWDKYVRGFISKIQLKIMRAKNTPFSSPK